eukprot:gene7111-17130_t
MREIPSQASEQADPVGEPRRAVPAVSGTTSVSVTPSALAPVPSSDFGSDTTRPMKLVGGPVLNERYEIYHIFFRDPDGHLLEVQEFRSKQWPRA